MIATCASVGWWLQGGVKGLPSAREFLAALGFTCSYRVHDRGTESSQLLVSSISYVAAIIPNAARFTLVHLQSGLGLCNEGCFS